MKFFQDSYLKLKTYQKAIFAYLLLFITYLILLPHSSHGWDTYCWKEWSKHIFTNGLGNAYKSWTDYLPLYQYFLWFFGLIQGSIENIEKNIYLLKIFTLIFDFIGGFFLIKLIKEKVANSYEWFFYSMFFFINIAVFYNTLLWGQVDGILATLIFISIYFAIKERVLISIVFFVLAINMKLQAIIFLPVWGLIILPSIIKNFSWIRLTKWVSSIIILQFIILLPFIVNGDFQKIIKVITDSFGKYPVISMNAYNIWVWFFKGDLMKIPDTGRFIGFTFKSWGLILFFISSFVALWPLLLATLKRIFRKSEVLFSVEKILLISAIIPLIFFFFNTQMHERYLHPSLIFIIAYSIISKDFLPTVLVCITYFLNLEDVLRFLQLGEYRFILFKDYFISILYFVSILILYSRLFEVRLNRSK